MRKVFLILFLILSFITHPVVPVGIHTLFSRITYGDIFGGIAILMYLPVLIDTLFKQRNISPIFIAGGVLLLALFLPIYFSLNPQATAVECLILLFLLLVAWCMSIEFENSLLTIIFPLISSIVIVATFIGVYDLSATYYDLVRIFPEKENYPGVMMSGFRNSGQAGSYMQVMLTVLIPLRFSQLYGKISSYSKKLLNISLCCGIVFLHLTAKYSAIIGMVIGIVLFLIINFRNYKILSIFSFALIGLVIVTFLLKFAIPPSYERIVYKFENRIENRIDQNDIKNETQDNFIVSNFSAGIEAFKDRPLIGTGLGAFYKTKHTHEVHSTYMKMLAETGIIGLIGYAYFIYHFILLLLKGRRSSFIEGRSYINVMIPFLIGCFVSWSYTYHLRKREFWILLVVIFLITQSLPKNCDKAEVS